jgi:hypothetical protein
MKDDKMIQSREVSGLAGVPYSVCLHDNFVAPGESEFTRDIPPAFISDEGKYISGKIVDCSR